MQASYGQRGIIGLATPQGNPTAETEFRVLLPAGVIPATARLVSKDADPRHRLRDYFVDLSATLDRFDSLPLASVGIACTGSSYVLGHAEAERRCREVATARSLAVVSAADAIDQALRHLGVSRLALLCPYPEWLELLAVAYWQDRGYSVLDVMSVAGDQHDTRSIYRLDPASHTRSIHERWSSVTADAYLITGTGMPSLGLIDALSAQLKAPVLSSTLCLAWACLGAADINPGSLGGTAHMPLLAGWSEALARL